MSHEFETEPAHWISGAAPAHDFRCTVKTRYRQPDQECRVTVLDDGRVRVHADAAQRAVTPGQSAVFYDGEVCLGGGVIARVQALVVARMPAAPAATTP